MPEDGRLRHAVMSRLDERRIWGLQVHDVQAHGGTVWLRGDVNDLRAREVAVSCCRRVFGVRQVVDELRSH